MEKNEAPRACAIREVLEETGFDFGKHSTQEEVQLEKKEKATLRLFIVPDVPMDFPFAPQTKNEIRLTPDGRKITV